MILTSNTNATKILKQHILQGWLVDNKDRDRQLVIVGGRNKRPTNTAWRTAAIKKIH